MLDLFVKSSLAYINSFYEYLLMFYNESVTVTAFVNYSGKTRFHRHQNITSGLITQYSILIIK